MGSGVWCMYCGVWCLVSGVWCLVSGVSCLVFEIRTFRNLLNNDEVTQ